MKINRSAGSFAPAGNVEKALSLNVHATGEVSFSSDVAGARIQVDQADNGRVTIAEILADGTVGESVTVETVAPAPVDPVAEVEKPAKG